MVHERRRASGSVVLLVALTLPLAASAQVVRLGVEFQVNTYTTQYQRFPAVAARTDGAFVVAWASNGQDGSSYGIFARRFSSAGTALAVEFQVNTTTSQSQNIPAVGIDSDGDFVVVWQSAGQGYFIVARRYSSSGTALAGEFMVNSFLVGNQYDPTVSTDIDGDFVIAWTTTAEEIGYTNVFARRFSSAGTALAAEFRVNSHTVNQQDQPSVAAEANGDFVVVWSSFLQDQSYRGVFARRFSSAGTPLAAEFQVNTSTLGAQYASSIATDADGDFVVAWSNYTEEVEDALDVFARRFTSAGTAVAGEFQVNDFTLDKQRRPSVAGHGAGGFLVSWDSNLQDTASAGVFARRLSNAGAAIGAEFQVHTYTSSFQNAPAVAASSDGKIVVAWQSAHDGSSTGIFAQRLAALATLDIDGSLSVEPLTDGLLLLRYMFGFRGATLVSGAVDLLDCTRCDVPAIEAYLASPPLPGFGQANRQGTEFLVNSYTPGYVFEPTVAAEADGDFVVAWSSYGRDGSNYGVFGRRFSSAGVGLAIDFQVSTFTLGSQYQSSVATEANGDFVVAWTSNGQDGSEYGVFARRFSSAGSPLAAELQVNTYTTGAQGFSALVADGDGDFVVAWSSVGQDGSLQGIFARRLSSSGSPLATEFQVNTYVTNQQHSPALAIDGDGDFVVAWVSEGQDGADRGIFARRFSSAGVALTGEFQVSLHTLDRQEAPSLAMDADGDFLATWSSNLQDGSLGGVFARRYSSAGAALAGEFQVNTYTPGLEKYSRIAHLADDTFVIAWQDFQDGSFYGVRARRFTSTGGGLSPEFQVNSYTFLDQRFARLATGAGSRFIAIWRSVQDGSETSIQGQRLVFPNTFDVDGNGLVDPLTDGLLALRYLFGFRGATLITGAVGAGCTRCDAPAIEAYLAGLTS